MGKGISLKEVKYIAGTDTEGPVKEKGMGENYCRKRTALPSAEKTKKTRIFETREKNSFRQKKNWPPGISNGPGYLNDHKALQ